MSKNIAKSFALMAALGALFVFIGGYFGGTGGMIIALVFAGMMNLGMYWFSDKLVIKATRSRAVSEQEAPWLYRIVRRLADRASMPMPRLYVMPASQPNAFATGRSPQHAAVAVTEGILNVLSEEELEGVLAHELAHVKNRDVLIGAVAATVAVAIAMLARMAMWSAMFGGGRGRRDNPMGAIGMLVAIIVAPLAAMIVRAAVSRARETEADRSGAHLLGDATPLASALIKIHQASKVTPPPEVNPAVAHVFLHDPFPAAHARSRGHEGDGLGLARFFMSHPPLEERLEQLRKLGARV